MPEPSVGAVLDLHIHLTNVWSETHLHWREVDSYLDGTFKLWPDNDNRPKAYPAKASAILDDALNQNLPQTAHVKRFSRKQGNKRQEQADDVELFLQAVLHDITIKESHLTIPLFKRHVLAYGYGVLEGPLLDGKALDGDPPYNSPFRGRAPHPQRVLMDPSQRNPGEAIKSVRRFAREIDALVERKGGGHAKVYRDVWTAGQNPFEEIETKEYWSDDWHLFLVNDQLLYTEPNTWGYLPFLQSFSGWGSEPTDLTKLNPRHMAVGILDHILDGLKRNAQSVAAKHNALIEAAFFQHGYGGKLAPTQAAEDIATGALLQGEKEQWWIKEVPNLPNWLFQVGKETDEDIEAGSVTKSQSGQRIPGVTTGVQQAIISGQGARKFDAPAISIDATVTAYCENLLKLVAVVGEKVRVRGFTIGPEDIKGDYSVEVTYQLEDDIMRAQERSIGMEEVKAFILDPETYLTDTGRENAVEILRKARVHKMLNTEQVLGTIIEAANTAFKIKHAPKPGSGLLGPNGQPVQSQPFQPANPALEAMQSVPGGPAEQQVLSTQLDGLSNGAAPAVGV